MIDLLNDKQQEAVVYGDGPLLILAGAGSGKTRVLTHRIANLIGERFVSPHNILAVTFTNKAAGEMKERLGTLLKENSRGLSVGTFHSICSSVLRRDIDILGYSTKFSIYDDRDQLSAIKTIMERKGLDDKAINPKRVQALINDAKNRGIPPADLARAGLGFFKDRLVSVVEDYEKLLKEGSALDFGDLIYLTVLLFEKAPELLEQYRSRWKYILVDEYQDTNPVQYKLIRQIAGEAMNVTVVGDDDQSIYRWRGADIQNILDFERDFAGAHVIRLEQNYRSTQNILSAAGAVVEKNTGRKGKRLWTNGEEGEPLTICCTGNEYDETRFILDEIDKIKKTGRTYSDFAVFYRTNSQSRVIEDEAIKRGIPYTVVGGMKFYDRMEIKDLLAYLRVIINPHDSVSMMRIINTPPRGIGKKAIEELEERAVEKGVSLFSSIEMENNNKKVMAFRSLLFELMEYAEKSYPVEILDRVLDKSGYMKKLQEENSIESRTRIENIDELAEAIREFSGEEEDFSLEMFLERASLVNESDKMEEGAEKLTLMTLHSAKGLEFPFVFMAGMEENLFPHSRSKDDPEGLEEERRLCYVGMTRAMERLYLSYAQRRRVFGAEQHNIPSRYLSDIPEELTDNISFFSAPSPSWTVTKPDMHPERGGLFGAGFGTESVHKEEKIGDFAKGDRVLHPTFGEGVVRGGEGSGDKAKIQVYFPRIGLKNLVIKYASMEKI